MEPALAGRPYREFSEPRKPVSFQPWERGPSSLSYDPYYVAPQEEDEEKEKPKASAPPARDEKPERGEP